MDDTPNWIVIALAGSTNSGKTTLAEQLKVHFKNVVHLKQDDYFLNPDDPRHVRVESLGHNNWEKLTALDMDKMVLEVNELINRPINTKPNLLILDGFLILNDIRIASLCHLKFYIDVGFEECQRRRQLRSYDPPDVPGYFEQVVWPESRISKQEALAANTDVVVLNGELEIEILFKEIVNSLNRKFNL